MLPTWRTLISTYKIDKNLVAVAELSKGGRNQRGQPAEVRKYAVITAVEPYYTRIIFCASWLTTQGKKRCCNETSSPPNRLLLGYCAGAGKFEELALIKK